MPQTTAPEVWRLTAAETAAEIRAGRLSCAEATDAALARMEAVNPGLNAVVESLAEEARARARALDAAQAEGAPTGPLHGVPVTIKVNVDQTGHATTNGVAAYRDVIAPDDAPVVTNLLRAGAVPIGRTNTPEFSFRADTDNPLYGRTQNPWGAHISPGGSSGGAGAAVMAGIGALAHGNDIGGSLRFPAAANGAVTVKPGLGRVPAFNPSQKAERGMLAQAMSVQGLLARTATDLALAMPALIAADPRDPFHVPLPYAGDRLEPPLRVAFTKDCFGFPLHPEVSAALDAAAHALSAAGYEVEEVAPPAMPEAARVGYRALMGETKALLGEEFARHGSPAFQALFEEYFRQYPPYEGAELLDAMARRSAFAREWSRFQDRYPLALTPFLSRPFFAPDRDLEGEEGMIEALGSALWSFAMNFMGLPAGNVPARLADLPQGPQPIGVQIVGRRWREDLVVEAMTAIEAQIGPMAPHLWARMD
ncbi:amidase [Rhodosalinus halophilus]|uniref:Amidase n=1 Tax=Rhodosalinus halophilus TaxID=2259333 RepID=A0A365UBD0_9RHOB|nr:amidase [Rhodosalinus halophilus]RBI86617.1 amidase [Rhodosalinus halophilus]